MVFIKDTRCTRIQGGNDRTTTTCNQWYSATALPPASAMQLTNYLILLLLVKSFHRLLHETQTWKRLRMPFADVAFSDGIWKKSAPHPHARRHTYTKRLHDWLKITILMKEMIEEYFFIWQKKKKKKKKHFLTWNVWIAPIKQIL